MTKLAWGGKRKGAGRPKGITKIYKTLSIAVPEEEAVRIRLLAQESGKSMARYISDRILGEDEPKEQMNSKRITTTI